MKHTNAILFILTFLFLFVGTSRGDDQSAWRFYTSEDGLKESWVQAISIAPNGSILISHGNVDRMSIYDGYHIEQLPSPTTSRVVYQNQYDQIWSIRIGVPPVFVQWLDGQWKEWPIPPPESNWKSLYFPFYPLRRDRIVYLLPERTLLLTAPEKSISVIRSATETALGHFYDMVYSRQKDGLWITGDHGVALLRMDTKSGEKVRWEDDLLPDSMRFDQLREPIETNQGNLYVIGTNAATEEKSLLRFNGKSWERISIPATKDLRAGWEHPDGAVWVIEGTQDQWDISRGTGNELQKVPKNRILSSRLFGVAVESDGNFWLATSRGLAHYASPSWRSLMELRDIEPSITAICGDTQGRIWFQGALALYRFQDGTVRAYPMRVSQDSQRVAANGNNTFRLLPDGRILVGNDQNGLLLFNPDMEQFETLNSPDGSKIVMAYPQKNGCLILLILDSRTNKNRLDRYSDGHFQTILSEVDMHSIGGECYILEAEDGDDWLIGIYGAARIHEGEYHVFTPEEGYTGAGGFTILERSDHHIWFGGRDKIMEWDGSAWHDIRTKGLETVRSLIEARDGSVWIASGTGITRYYQGSWVLHDAHEGLPDASGLQIYEDRDGEIWAVTLAGVRFYQPAMDVDAPDTILSPDDNSLEISPGGETRIVFRGVDRWRQTSTDRLLYSYRLDQQNWTPFSSSSLFSRAGLTAGVHQFEVRAMDRNWNIDPSPAQFEFTVLRPWYQTPDFLWIALICFVVIVVLLVYAIAHYIWMEKMVEQRTRQLEERQAIYRTLVENLPQCVFLKDTSSRFVSANASLCQFMNHPLEEIIGKTDFDFISKEQADEYEAVNQQILSTGIPVHLIEQNWIGDRHTWLEIFKIPIKNASGQITGLMGIFWDITERRQMEEDLRHNQELLENAQKIARIGSWDSNIITQELTWSKETYRIFGLLPREFEGTLEAFYNRTHPEDVEFVRNAGEAAIRNHKPYQIDHRIVLPDGSIRWVREQAELILDEKKNPIHLVGTVQDITDQKETEKAIRNLARFPDENPNPVMRVSRNGILLYANDAASPLLSMWEIQQGDLVPSDLKNRIVTVLDTKVIHRTEIICNLQFYLVSLAPVADAGYVNLYGMDITEQKKLEDQLRQSQKMEAIGLLAGGVAHDFNNMLMAIQGYCEFAMKNLEETHPSWEDLQEVKKASDRAAALTRQLLAFSRKQVLEPKLINLNELIVNMDKMLRRLIGEDIDLVTYPDRKIDLVKADPSQIEQILMNLAVNARDAMPKGGKLTLETRNVFLDENYVKDHVDARIGWHVMIAVSDTGMGMSKETLSRIFDPFFTTKEMGRGTGLGLSTVYGIVKQSGGNILVYSELGKGATFKIYFPRSEEEHYSDIVLPSMESLDGHETILLVEDDDMVRKVVTRSMNHSGYQVFHASSGPEAMEIINKMEIPPDLLVTDVIMPGMSGKELAEKILFVLPRIKVLFMSGYTENAIVHHGVLDSGINFIPKPFSAQAFLEKVRLVLDQK